MISNNSATKQRFEVFASSLTMPSILHSIFDYIVEGEGMDESLKSHFLNLYSFALADRNFDEEELRFLYQIAEVRGIKQEEVDEVILNPFKVSFVKPEGVSERITFLYDFALLVWVDGEVHPHEEHLLNIFCGEFEFKSEFIPQIVKFLLDEAEKKPPLEDVLKILQENL